MFNIILNRLKNMMTKLTKREKEVKKKLIKLGETLTKEAIESDSMPMAVVANAISICGLSLDNPQRMHELALLMAMFSAKAIMESREPDIFFGDEL